MRAAVILCDNVYISVLLPVRSFLPRLLLVKTLSRRLDDASLHHPHLLGMPHDGGRSTHNPVQQRKVVVRQRGKACYITEACDQKRGEPVPLATKPREALLTREIVDRQKRGKLRRRSAPSQIITPTQINIPRFLLPDLNYVRYVAGGSRIRCGYSLVPCMAFSKPLATNTLDFSQSTTYPGTARQDNALKACANDVGRTSTGSFQFYWNDADRMWHCDAFLMQDSGNGKFTVSGPYYDILAYSKTNWFKREEENGRHEEAEADSKSAKDDVIPNDTKGSVVDTIVESDAAHEVGPDDIEAENEGHSPAVNRRGYGERDAEARRQRRSQRPHGADYRRITLA